MLGFYSDIFGSEHEFGWRCGNALAMEESRVFTRDAKTILKARYETHQTGIVNIACKSITSAMSAIGSHSILTLSLLAFLAAGCLGQLVQQSIQNELDIVVSQFSIFIQSQSLSAGFGHRASAPDKVNRWFELNRQCKCVYRLRSFL